jgi:hypothetical protein
MSTVGRGLIYGEPGSNPVKYTVTRSLVPDILYRKGKLLLSNNGATISLIDPEGRRVLKSKFVNGKSVIDLTGVKHGIYLAKSGDKVIKINIIKQ